MLRKSILALALGASFALPLYAQSNSTPQAAGAGNSDQNGNPVSGQLGNQGNDRPVGNAGGNRGNRGDRDEGTTTDSRTPNPGTNRRPPAPRQTGMDGSGPQVDQARPPRRDRDDNPLGPRGGPGTNWENRPGPQDGPGASPDRRPPPREPGMGGGGQQGDQGRPPRRDRDDNPPGPRGGPGTNWENPPGPQGGPGASPDRRPPPRHHPGMGGQDGDSQQDGQARQGRRDRDDNPPGRRGGPGTNWENPPGPQGGPGASPDRPARGGPAGGIGQGGPRGR